MKLHSISLRFLSTAILIGLATACSPKTEPVAADVSAPASDPDAVAAVEPAADAAAEPAIDTAAITALEKMGTHLRTLQSFEVAADFTTEDVLENGMKVQYAGKVTYRVRKPDKFVVDTNTDRKKRTFYYDGKTFTLYSPRMKFYAQADAPPTVREAVATIAEKYGLELPLADLFHWGEAGATTDDIESAVVVGYAKIDGVDCGQYAFRQGDVDWQVFIQTGDKPLPRKLVITTLTDDARPQFVALLNWKADAKFADTIFTFKPPEGAQRIHIEESST
jgi:hypothetical protein